MDNKRESLMKTTASLIAKLSLDLNDSKQMRAYIMRSAVAEDDPNVFGWLFSNVPEELQGNSGSLSYAESAIYLALMSYVFSRGKEGKETFVQVMKREGIDRRHLYQIEYVETLEEIKRPLLTLLQYIASKKKEINYVKLAADLYDFQYDRMKVIRKWEREYSTYIKGGESDEK